MKYVQLLLEISREISVASRLLPCCFEKSPGDMCSCMRGQGWAPGLFATGAEEADVDDQAGHPKGAMRYLQTGSQLCAGEIDPFAHGNPENV